MVFSRMGSGSVGLSALVAETNVVCMVNLNPSLLNILIHRLFDESAMA